MPEPPPQPPPRQQHAPDPAVSAPAAVSPRPVRNCPELTLCQPAPQLLPPPPEPAPVPERRDFEAFARHLQDAVMHIYRQTRRPPYAAVSALLLRWDDDRAAEPDVAAVEKVLRDHFRFHADVWTIPTVVNPTAKLTLQMANLLERARPDHLLIIYYAGHSYVGPDKQLYWAR